MITLPAAAMDAPLQQSAQTPDEESTLLRRWRDRGEREAIEALAGRLADLGYRVARSIIAERAEAEDAVQDAFVRLLSKAHQWRGDRPVRGWFAVTVANVARSRLRSTRVRRRGVPADQPVEPANEPEERARTALAELPEDQRLSIWLHVVEGMTCRDIARSLGEKEGTVRSRVSRGLDRLRARLGRNASDTAASLALLGAVRAPDSTLAWLMLAKPPAATIGAVTVSIVGGALLALAGLIGVALLWWPAAQAQPKPAPAAAADATPPAAPATVFDRAVAVTFRHENLADAIVAIEAALPPGERIAWTGPRDDGHEPYGGATWVGRRAAPVRAILDDAASQLGMRWYESDGGAVFSRVMEPRRMAELARQLTDAGSGMARRNEAAYELARSCDVLAVRELLLALAMPREEVVDAVTARFRDDLPSLSTPGGPWAAGGISAFAALRGDAAVEAALAARLRQDVAAGKPRWEVVEACGYFRIAAARADLDALAAKANNATRRAQGWYGDVRAMDQLLGRPRWRNDFIAYESLAVSRDARAADNLIGVVADQAIDAQHRASAARALAHRQATPAIVAAFGAGLADPRQPMQLRGVFAECLGRLGSPDGVPALTAALAASDLEDNDQKLALGPANLAVTIIRALALIRDRQATPAVLAALARSLGKPIEVRSAIYEYAFRTRDPALIPAFRELMLDPGTNTTVVSGALPTSTEGAAMILGLIGTPEALRILEEVAHGSGGDRAEDAWGGLARTRSDGVTKALLEKLAAVDPQTRRTAYDHIFTTRDPQALVTALRAALGEPDQGLHDMAVFHALARDSGNSTVWLPPAQIGDAEVLDSAIDLALRPAPGIGSMAFRWLCAMAAQLPQRERSVVLARLRADPDPTLRASLAKELEWNVPPGSDDIFAAVVDRVAHDDDAGVRLAACTACAKAWYGGRGGWYGDQAAAALAGALGDRDAAVAAAARRLLEAKKDEERDLANAAAARRGLDAAAPAAPAGPAPGDF